MVIYCLMTEADVSVTEAGYVRKGEGRCVPVIVVGQHAVKLSSVAFAFWKLTSEQSRLEHLEFHSTTREA